MTESLDRAAIKARAEAASGGPWSAAKGATPDGKYLTTTKAEKEEFLRLALNNDDAELWLIDNADVIPAVTGDGPNAQANAEFIAHAREDIPALLAALEEAERERDDLDMLARVNAMNTADWVAMKERAENAEREERRLREAHQAEFARAENAERRIAAALSCYGPDPSLPLGISRWRSADEFLVAIRAALHPVATEGSAE